MFLLATVVNPSSCDASLVQGTHVNSSLDAGAADSLDDGSDGLSRPDSIAAGWASREGLAYLLVSNVGAVSIGEGKARVADPSL